jgi:thioesterase domain-containing protein/aryl carrier-like protein
MLPSAIVVLESLPLNPSGKVDRKALPDSDNTEMRTYVPPSTEEGKLLAEIWQEVLGIERVGETDNFFALGGDSLLCLKVMSRMNSLGSMKFHFKIRDLMERPTIAALLQLEPQNQDGPYMPLILNLPHKKTKNRSLFCIHGGSGTVFDYQPLARHLQGKWNVYGLPSRMLTNPAHRDISLDQMAADYCQIIRRVQPEGPYHLLGWSLGGTLAAMIAAFLEADAQSVSFLGLVDSFIPGNVERSNDDWHADFLDFLSIVIPGSKPGDVMNTSLWGVESEKTIISLLEHLISAEQTRDTRTPGYADMGADQLARIFIVTRRLKALALQAPVLNSLQVQPTCWWIAERSSSDRLALALQIEQNKLQSIEVDADHFAIVRHNALLVGVESALENFLPTTMETEMAL